MRFHSKYHNKNHHSLPTVGYPDSASDPIASSDDPFQGDFVITGTLSAGTASFVNSIPTIIVDDITINNEISTLSITDLTVTGDLNGDGSSLTNVDALTLGGVQVGDVQLLGEKDAFGGYLGISLSGDVTIPNNASVYSISNLVTLNGESVYSYLTTTDLSSSVAPLISSDNIFGKELPDELLPKDITEIETINNISIDDYLITTDLSSSVAPLIDSGNTFGKELPKELLPSDFHNSYVGSFDYNASNALSSVSLSAGVWNDIENDITGPYTLTSYGPTSVTKIWDETTNLFDWSELKLGDMIDIRVDVEVTTGTNNAIFQIDLVLAEGSASEYRIPFQTETLIKDSGSVPRFVSYKGIYIGNTDTLNNGGKFQIWTDDLNATMKVHGWYCKVTIL